MIQYLKKIREPNDKISMRVKIIISISIALTGFLLGIIQKHIDGTDFNDLPQLFQYLDLGNYFGRLSFWILIATVISVYSVTPIRASINTFIFFISMVSGYYLYCNYVLGFLPTSYMLIWVVISFISPFIAFICWYAKGKGIIAVIISTGILGVLFSQAFLITQGFYVTHLLDVITWGIGLIVLYRKPKEFIIELGLSLIVAFAYQLFIPYWG